MNNPQLQNLQQTVANAILIIDISKSNNFNKHLHTSIKSTKQDLVSELVIRVANDRSYFPTWGEMGDR